MRITNIRRGRIYKVLAFACIAIPVIYLLFTWSDGVKSNKLSHSIKSARRGNEVPILVSG